jgi:hypothetical protein
MRWMSRSKPPLQFRYDEAAASHAYSLDMADSEHGLLEAAGDQQGVEAKSAAQPWAQAARGTTGAWQHRAICL